MPELRHAIEPEEIMAYLDGELPAARASEAMTHLERCAECQKLASDLRRVSQEMAAWEVEPPPRALAAPAGAPSQPNRWTLRRLIPMPHYVVTAGAVFAAAVFIGAVWTLGQPRRAIYGTDSVSPAPSVPPSQFGARFAATFAGQQGSPAAAPSAAKSTPVFLPADTVAETKPAAAAPMIERTAALTLATHDFDQLRARIDAILARRRGYLANLTLNTPQGAGRSLSATLRVPAADLDAALADLRQLGRVESESQKGDDVTRQYADLVARLANARNTAQRLSQILAQRTGKLSDVLDVEREMARVRGEIEQMEAEQRTTADQVAFATVELNAGEDYKAQLRLAPDSKWTRLDNAGVEGYRNLAGGVDAVPLILIAYGPSVLLWCALSFLVARWLLRRRRV